MRRLFLVFGFLVGVIGSAVGVGTALAFGAVQSQFGLLKLPQDAYYLDRVPIEIHGTDVVITVIATITLCVLASYLPARTASGIEPIRTIRFGG